MAMDFEQRLEHAVKRGERARASKSQAAAEERLSQEDLKNLHSQFRLELSEHIEQCLEKLSHHFPGFRYESVVSEAGWGAKVSRDDLELRSGRSGSNYYSRLEMLISPFGSVDIVELLGKGTIRNKEIFNRRHFQLLTEADLDSFLEVIDLWTLEYAEQYAAARKT